MKYLNGGWLTREGFEVYACKEVYDVKEHKDHISLYLPFKKIKDKGMTLDGGMLTLEIYPLEHEVFELKIAHFMGIQKHEPNFSLQKKAHPFRFQIHEHFYEIVNGAAVIQIDKESAIMRFLYHDQCIVSHDASSLVYLLDEYHQPHIAASLSLDVGETIYGLGERFSHFVKNGQSIIIDNQDAGTSTTQAYKNIPFYLSSRHYGVFVNSPDQVEFEVGSEKVSQVQMSVPGEAMDYFIFLAKDNKQVLEKYTDLTGKPALPPAWSFGLWLSTSFLTNYDEKTVNEFVDGMQKRNIPLDVFHFDCLWMKEYEWCNFTFNEDMFPHPVEMLKKLKSKGLKICVWINPYIGQKSPLFEEGMKHGYFLHKKNGDIWQWDRWQAGMAIVDFTNPEAYTWYQQQLKKLLDLGVDCFKTDFGERIPKDVVYFNHADAHKMHNYYTYLYNKAVYELLVQEKGQENAVVFARSATVGSQRFPVHWGGDSNATYASMAETLRGGLSFGLSGFGFWSHDISGFESGADPDIYKRWSAFGLLSSHSRYHGSWQYKVPWIYGDEAVEVTRQFTCLKLSLMPYLMSQAVDTSQTGIPMLRAMILDFSEDETAKYLDRQYMLGDSLLVAPVFNKEGTATFYVPADHGPWTDYLTGKKYQSGFYKESYDYLHLPLLVRPNHIIIEGHASKSAAYDYSSHIIVHVFELYDNAKAIVYDEYGHRTGFIEVTKNEDHIYVSMEGLTDVTLRLHNETVQDYKITGDTIL